MIRTWDEHSYSWHKQKMLPVHFVKYEEMKLNPNKAFKEMINFLGLNFLMKQLHWPSVYLISSP
ncbi:sulfotransferase domain-containing protein [Emticicia fluvialis]|uniref:sulfotransferase domain-containing protein n=1 Tax=Emticicia fluvialis TaxID=2974474 RepID=UPI0036F2ECDC